MKSRVKYRDINDIIERQLKPRLKSECERLGIPQSFIAGIYGIYPEVFNSSCCEVIEQDGLIKTVRIRIDSEICSPQIALMHFGHELRHAKDCHENKKPSERRAHLYVLRRYVEQVMSSITLRLAQKRNLQKSLK